MDDEIRSLRSWDGTGKIYSEETVQMLQDEIAQLQARVTELVEQANAAYGPYQQKVNYLQNLVSMKNDALSSYAEFYGRAASLCGLPEDALPGSETDAIILQRLAEHDEIARLTAALREANSALISMVYQYCYRPLDANKEPAIDIYQHDFMSAGEEAFAYLVEHGLAKWTDESHYAILINSKTSLSVKSDDLGKGTEG